MNEEKKRLKTLCAGIISLILSLGIARFSYTPLLPLMQQQAGLGLAEAGWLAALNYAGYLSGAFIASLINDLVLKDRLYRVGMITAVVSTAVMGLTNNLTIWILSRFIAGLCSAAGLIVGTGLILNWLIRHDHRSELGIHFSGIGLSIAFCALAASLMHPWLDWRQQWFTFTAIGCLLLVPALGWFPSPDRSLSTKSGKKIEDKPPSTTFMSFFIAAYFCAGFGYVISATFIVAIINRLPGLDGNGNLVFMAIGIGAAPACILWDLIARRTGDINALILAAGLQIIGILLPVQSHGLAAAFAGALIFGSTFVGIVSLVLTMAGRYYPTRPAKMMGKMSVSYGLAQISGPAITGWLAARMGSYEISLYVAATVVVIGIFLLLFLKILEKKACGTYPKPRAISDPQSLQNVTLR